MKIHKLPLPARAVQLCDNVGTLTETARTDSIDIYKIVLPALFTTTNFITIAGILCIKKRIKVNPNNLAFGLALGVQVLTERIGKWSTEYSRSMLQCIFPCRALPILSGNGDIPTVEFPCEFERLFLDSHRTCRLRGLHLRYDRKQNRQQRHYNQLIEYCSHIVNPALQH